ncbi:MAG: M20/M25/M40 family metallo-hydrolase [Lachnospiraceae bacterium]|nr:M20/M25/M40 family metallo-hydrolase [Lachnospiraceae bacterium]
MNIWKTFESIEAQKEKYTDFLCKICAFEARAYDKAVIDSMNDAITLFAKNEGFSVKRTFFEKCGDFLTIEINEGAPKGGVFLAHTDTVHEKGVFGNQPVKDLGDRIQAPGAIDCKGGIAVALLMMKSLKDNGYAKNLRLLLTSDEEISNVLGGKEELQFFTENVQGYPFALNCETTEKDEVVVSRKGILRYQIDITGVSGHSGIHYFESKNALAEAAHKIVALENSSQEGGTTYSCNKINAGNVPNIIPETCSFIVDVRVHTQSAMDTAKQTVQSIVEKKYIGGTSAVLTLLSERPPMEKTKETMQLFNSILAVTQKYGLGNLTPVQSGGGSDSCYTQSAGVTSLCGLGPSGEFCHTPKEYVKKDTIPLRAKILAAFLSEQ